LKRHLRTISIETIHEFQVTCQETQVSHFSPVQISHRPRFHFAPDFTLHHISPHPTCHPAPHFTLLQISPQISPRARFHPSHISPLAHFTPRTFHPSHISTRRRFHPAPESTPPQMSPAPRFHPAADFNPRQFAWACRFNSLPDWRSFRIDLQADSESHKSLVRRAPRSHPPPRFTPPAINVHTHRVCLYFEGENAVYLCTFCGGVESGRRVRSGRKVGWYFLCGG